MNTYFKLTDFFRVWDNGDWTQMPTPKRHILNDIVEDHFLPINNVRSNLGLALKVTRCFATKEYEYSKGRDGSSQHCFLIHDFGERVGACDIDLWDKTKGSKENYLKLAKQLSSSPYKRISWYPNTTFFHNDYKANNRQYFIYNPISQKWEYKQNKELWLQGISNSF